MQRKTRRLLAASVLIIARVASGTEAPTAGQDWTVPELGMEFVWLKGLKLWAGKYEVTNGEYRKFKASHDSKKYHDKSLNTDRQPVVYVNCDDATAFAAWLTDRERQAGRLPAGLVYRLPVEKEWEAYATCGDNRTYPWGREWPPKYGNYSAPPLSESFLVMMLVDSYNDGFAVTCPVEKSGRNDWGLFGVGGNVWECTTTTFPGAFAAWRGGAWVSELREDRLRCDRRLTDNGKERDDIYGFRLVLSPGNGGGPP